MNLNLMPWLELARELSATHRVELAFHADEQIPHVLIVELRVNAILRLKYNSAQYQSYATNFSIDMTSPIMQDAFNHELETACDQMSMTIRPPQEPGPGHPAYERHI